MSVVVDIEIDEFVLLSGAARDAAFTSTEREIRRLQALQAGRIRYTETTFGFVDDAFHSITAWLQAVTERVSRHRRVQGVRCPHVGNDAAASLSCRARHGW